MGDLAPGATVTVTVSATVGRGVVGTLTNTAYTDSPDESDPSNNVAQAVTEVTAAADLTVTKKPTSGTATAGGTVVWEITVLNKGPAPAADVLITDPLPAGLTVSGALPAGCAAAAGVVSCQVGELAAGQRKTFTIRTKIGAAVTGPVANAARVSSATVDPDPRNNVDAAVIQVTAPIPPNPPTPPTNPPTPPTNQPNPPTGWGAVRRRSVQHQPPRQLRAPHRRCRTPVCRPAL